MHPLQNVVQAVSRNGSCDEHWWWRLAATLCPRATAGADRSATVAAKVSAAAARNHRVQVCQLLAIRMRLRELRGLTHRLSPRLHELQLGVRNVTMSNVTM